MLAPSFFRTAFLAAMLVFMAACTRKSDPVTAANAFFTSLRKGDTRAAYTSAAFSFQAQQNFSDFQTAIDELGLVDYATLQWTPEFTVKDEARLDGVITKRSGVNVPIFVTLVPEAGVWKIFTLSTTGSDPSKPAPNSFSLIGKTPNLVNLAHENMPTEKDSIALVQKTFALMDGAMQQNDFTELYNSMAHAWRMQFSQNRLAQVFEPLLNSGQHLDSVQNAEPIFDPKPYVDDHGMLVMCGYFPVQPHRVTFQFAYLYELPAWKLVEIKNLSIEN